MPQWLPMDWPYIAGFFDGEGSVLCKDANHQRGSWRMFRLHIYQNDRTVLDEIVEFLNYEGIEATVAIHARLERAAKGHATSYMLTVNGAKNVCTTLVKMLPYLRVKRDKAEAALEWAFSLFEMVSEGGGTHYTHNRYLDLEPILTDRRMTKCRSGWRP